MKKIYSKFVKDRKKEFQIETALWEKDGQKYVSKRALYTEGKLHVENIIKTYEMYKETKLLCPVMADGDKVMFDFITGDTFESMLISALKDKDRELIQTHVSKYNDIVGQVCNENNVIFDLTFDNIIFCENQPQIIDYEWRFESNVDIEFIKFRAVFAFIMKYGGYVTEIYTKEEFYSLFGIVPENEAKFLEYNQKFIEYVYGEKGYNSILEKYEKTSMEVFNNDTISLLKRIEESKKSGEATYENKCFEKLLQSIETNKECYDDYTKFFKVSKKVKEMAAYGYTDTKEYYEEFAAYIDDMYGMISYFKNDMVGYYKNEVEHYKKVIEEYKDVVDSCRKDIEYYKSGMEAKDEELSQSRQREIELDTQLQNTVDRKVRRKLSKIKNAVIKKKG